MESPFADRFFPSSQYILSDSKLNPHNIHQIVTSRILRSKHPYGLAKVSDVETEVRGGRQEVKQPYHYLRYTSLAW